MAVITYKKAESKQLTKNFNLKEFHCQAVGCCKETLVDEKLVEYVQKIRDHFNKPVTISSGYRCSKHNAEVGGASNSRHAKGQAADIIVEGVAPSEVAKYAESLGIKGIGLYETAKDGHFVHIDTRTTNKYFWYGQAQSPRNTFGGGNPVTASVSTVNVELPCLQNGSSGEVVKTLQTLLKAKGYKGKDGKALTIDGGFGANTEYAVKAFQRANGLPDDGVVGKNTWEKLLRG